jgi:ATP-binding cassette subfamily B protein
LHNSIKLKNLSFKYQNSDDFVFQNLNFEIQKGDRIGIMGSTGSGKSTLIDLIMGLLSPSSGTIEIDSTALARDNDSVSAWQKNISHVPQNIYLSDSSILENIAFGIPNNKIDKNKVFNAAFGAQLINTIDSLPNKYETLVGHLIHF